MKEPICILVLTFSHSLHTCIAYMIQQNPMKMISLRFNYTHRYCIPFHKLIITRTYTNDSNRNGNKSQGSLLFFFTTTFACGSILLFGYSWIILHHKNILPDRLNQYKIVEKLPFYDKLNTWRDKWDTLKHEIPIISRYYKKQIIESDEIVNIPVQIDYQNDIDDIKPTIPETIDPSPILPQNDSLTRLMIQDILQEREESLRNIYLEELEKEKTRLKSKYESDMNIALYNQEQLLKDRWDSELQERLDNERQGRLSRLEDLGIKIEKLNERIDTEKFSSQFYHILQDIQLSIWNIQGIIDNENSIYDIMLDNQSLENLMDAENPVHSLSPLQIQDDLEKAKQTIHDAWYEKRESNRRILEQESMKLDRLTSELHDFVEIQVNRNANPQYHAYFKPTLDILESALPLSNKNEIFFEPIVTMQELDVELESMTKWLCISATILPFSSYLSHLISYISSKLEFSKKGLVPGKDIRAVLSRAKYWINNCSDLDMAVRELSNVKDYWPRLILDDWIKKAQRRLTIQQALKTIQAEILLCFGST